MLPEIPPGLNASMRTNRWELKKTKDRLALLTLAALPSRDRIPGPVLVTCTTFYARTPRDWDNAACAAKFPLDAIVRAGVLDDDNPTVISCMIHKQTKVPKVTDQGYLIEIETITP
jgi:hypothetical protein